MEGGQAHSGNIGQILDADGFGIVASNPPDYPSDLRHSAVSKAKLPYHYALLAVDEAPQDFAFDGGRQYRNVFRPI
jgi:hypothetical protein